MPSPDHMAGINALPKWDFNAPFDWRNYGPEQKAARAAAVAERAKADKERFAKSQADLKKTLKDVSRSIKDKMESEMRKTGLLDTPDSTDDATDFGEVLSIDTPSTCFASVEWQPIDDEGNGIVTGEFHRGGKLVYSGPMTRDEFLEWAEDESVGKFYNAQVDAF